MLDTVIHKWLRLPYPLHVRYIQRPKKARITVLFIHGIGTSGDQWSRIVNELPPDVNVVTIDLLGFGKSPMPKWATYNAKTQAHSVLATIFRLRVMTPIIIVGHSLGALVGIEMARRYPLLVKGLILCSPPLYRNEESRFPQSESILRNMYRAAVGHPDEFLRLTALAAKYKLIQGSFSLTPENVDSYMAALNSMIINQTSLDDAHRLKVPTLIIRGRLDPLVVPGNFTSLAKANPNIKIRPILAGHDIGTNKAFTKSIISAIQEQLQPVKKHGQ